MKSTQTQPEDAAWFEECNHTELLGMAREIDPNLCRSDSLEDLVGTVDGVVDAKPELRTNKIRLQIMDLVNANMDRVRPFVTCPAKSGDPHACFGCTDAQVVECYLENQELMEI